MVRNNIDMKAVYVALFVIVFAISVTVTTVIMRLNDKEQSSSIIDTDNDGVEDDIDLDDDDDCIPDLWEIEFGLDPRNASDKYQDLDGDGVDNKNEFDTSTDPTDPNSYNKLMQDNITIYGIPLIETAPFLFPSYNDNDYDDDGIPNDYEIYCLMDPFDPSNAQEDYDQDGMSNKLEYEMNTDPLVS